MLTPVDFLLLFFLLVFLASNCFFGKVHLRHQTESGVVCAALCMCMSPGYYLRKIALMHELESHIMTGFSKFTNKSSASIGKFCHARALGMSQCSPTCPLYILKGKA